MLQVVCGADLGPDILQVGHWSRCSQRDGGAALQRARGFGRRTHYRHFLHFVDLRRSLRRELARGRFSAGAAMATPILSNQRSNESEVSKKSSVEDGSERINKDIIRLGALGTKS